VLDLWLKLLVTMFGGKRDSRPPRWRMRMGSFMLRTFPGMVTCRQFDAFIADYLDGNLNERQQKIFRAHMEVCPMCRAHFETYVSTYQLSKKMFGTGAEPVPEDVPEELVLAVLDAARTGKSG